MKLALMAGQNLQKAFVGLPAGAQAIYTNAGLSHYRHAYWLGSARFASTASRTRYFAMAYAPFGETFKEFGTVERSFTGQRQEIAADSTAGLYDFLFREYAQYGRWTSPDPLGTRSVNVGQPQTWNRYAYVANDPLHYVDPLGLEVALAGDCIAFIDCGFFEDSNLVNYWCPQKFWGPPEWWDREPVPGPEINKLFSREFPCETDAESLMAAVQKDFSSFANYFSPENREFAVFPPGPIDQNQTVRIDITGSFFGVEGGLTAQVKVTQVNPTSFRFTVGQAEHFLTPGSTVTFSAGDVGGRIQFSVHAFGNFRGLYGLVEGKILAGEANTWNNLLNNIQRYCSQGQNR